MAENVEVVLRIRGSRAFVSQATAAATSVDKVGKATETTSKKAGKFGAVLKTGFMAGAVGVGALALGAKSALAAFEESRKVTAQTGAVIKSTGGAAKITAAQVGDLAGSISKKTGIDDEMIQSGENVLLTFSKIRNETGKGNDIFNQTTGIMTDMSAALGQDTKSSAMQLGKALNNPTKGVAALQRVGVAFTDSQKKQIKRLQESGKTMDAQKIILKELKSEFGGSAAAQATATDKMKVAWGNAMESIGGALAPVIDKLLTGLIPVVDRVGPLIETFFAQLKSGEGVGGKVASAFSTTADVVQTKLWPAIQVVVGGITDLVKGFQQGKTWAVLITAALTGLVAALVAYKVIVGTISAVTRLWAGAQMLLNAAMALNPIGLIIVAIVGLIAFFVVMYKKVDWFRNGVDAAFKWIKTAVQNVFNWIKTNWPLLVAILFGPFGLLVRYVIRNRDKIVSALKALPGMITRAVAGAFNGVKTAFQSAINWIIGKWNGLEFRIGGQKVFGKTLPGVTIGTPDLPLLAAGGTIGRGGSAVVGERGPEIVHLPRAAEVVPNSALPHVGAGAQTIVTQVFLDRRQIAEAIGTYTADRIARR